MKKPILPFFALFFACFLFAATQTQFAVLPEWLNEIEKQFIDFQDVIAHERVYVQTDKPLYRQGETVWLSVHLRNEKDFSAENCSEVVYVEWWNPKGEKAENFALPVKNGIAEGNIDIPRSAAGGIYRLRVYTNWQKNDSLSAIFEKEITVQAVVLPRLKMKLDFLEKGYGKGATAKANLTLENNENQPLSNTNFTYNVQLSGNDFLTQTAKTDANGKAIIAFQLPEDLQTNDGLLNITLEYQGKTEAISRSVPIVLQKVELLFFPEGGDILAGANQKIAFRAVNEYGQATDVKGEILNEKGKKVANFESFHRGRGAFLLKAKAGETYTARLTSPQNIEIQYSLPQTLTKGYSVAVEKTDKSFIYTCIFAAQKGEIGIFATVRGKAYHVAHFLAQKGENFYQIPIQKMPIGIAHITIFDAQKRPQAERLVFVNAHKKLNINLSTDKEKYLPREKVTLNIALTDENQQPVAGNFSLAVTDDQLLSFADDKSSHLLTWMLFESEIKEKVEEARLFFEEKDENSAQKMDFLLLTSGWRKFSWREILQKNTQKIAFQKEKLTLKGRVRDAETGAFLPNAKVFFDTEKQTITNSQGEFVLSGTIFSFYYDIEISCKGYISRRITLCGYPDSLSIALRDSANYLDKTHIPKIKEWEQGSSALLDEDSIILAFRNQSQQTNSAYKNNYSASEIPLAFPLNEQDSEDPDPNKFIFAQENPKPINLDEVRKMIGYPRIAKEAGIEGDVLLRVLVDEQGNCVRYLVSKSAHPLLQKRVEKAVPLLKFTPAIQLGRPIKFWANIPFKFSLKNANINYSFPDIYVGKVYLFNYAQNFPAIIYPKTQSVEKRTDFRTTIYWKGNVEVDKTGKTSLTFYNSDNISSFSIIAEGFSDKGLIGRGEKKFYTQMQMDISVSLPQTAVVGDTLLIPITLVNHTDSVETGELSLSFPAQMFSLSQNELIKVPQNQGITIYRKFLIREKANTAAILISWSSPHHKEKLEKKMQFLARGFPASFSISDKVLTKTFEIDIEKPLSNTISAELIAYPNLIASLLQGMEGILREPHGCFEQTTSATFPNILVLNYLKETNTINPALEQKALSLIESGYKRLISFECKSGGFEWFGSDPAHEGLTAYGLLEFTEMQKVYQGVDNEMIKRTKKWIHAQKDGKGGFILSKSGIDGFRSANKNVINPFVIYAMSEMGDRDFESELQTVFAAAMQEKQPYLGGLVANTLLNYGKKAEAKKMLEKTWKDLQTFDNERVYTACGSFGKGYKVESYALALMAFLKMDILAEEKIQTCLQYLAQSRTEGGGFGNSSATVMALRAILAYNQKIPVKPESQGKIHLFINEKEVESQNFSSKQGNPIIMKHFSPLLKEGKNAVKIEISGVEEAIPFTFSTNWKTDLPHFEAKCPLDFNLHLAKNQVVMGETIRLTASIENKTTETLPMAMMEIPLSSGFSPQPWQLKELQDKKIFDFYEIWLNKLVIYYRSVNPNEQKTFSLDLKTEFSGTFHSPAACAYLYYTPEYKDWKSIEKVNVK